MSQHMMPPMLDPAVPGTVLLPHLGTRLRGRYELLQVIGKGGMSTVFHAVDHMRLRGRASQPNVALKVASTPPPYEHAAQALIHREAQRMQAMHHPNIVRVFDNDYDGDTHFMVMELLQGRSLAAIMATSGKQGLAWPLAARIVAGVGAALDHAHAMGVVHTDLKAGNVFICGDGTLKVLDFGLAQRTSAVAAPADLALDDNTAHYLGLIGGLTPTIASPERLEGAAPTPGCDLFALGLLSYVLITGAHPFQRRTALEARALGLEPVRPEGLGQRPWEALRAALAFDQAERPCSVSAFTSQFLEPPAQPRSLLSRIAGWA
ncbi:serine/threonine-protein kinase [Xanthobacteraceae bacterium A53D]